MEIQYNSLGLLPDKSGPVWSNSWEDDHEEQNPKKDLNQEQQQQQQQQQQLRSESPSPKKSPTPLDVVIPMEVMESFELEPPPGENGDYSTNVLVVNLPVLGRLHILKNTWGFIPLGLIVVYWLYGSWSIMYVILKPHYDDGVIGEPLVFAYGTVSVLCIASLFRASTMNPGRIPFSREPPATAAQMTDNHCPTCRRRRPLRSHHCRRCGQCVLRMDHHCPWINNCVGQENHWAFVQLLWYAFLMSAMALVICICHIYLWPPCQKCDMESFPLSYANGLLIGSIIVSAWMCIAMAIMLMSQSWSLLASNRTILWLSVMLSACMMCAAGCLVTFQVFSLLRASHMWRWGIYLVLLALGLALVMAVASAILLVNTILGLKTDMTTIDWMVLQSELQKRRHWDPKDIPSAKKTCLQAHDDLCGRGPRWLWPFPCRRRSSPLFISYPETV